MNPIALLLVLFWLGVGFVPTAQSQEGGQIGEGTEVVEEIVETPAVETAPDRLRIFLDCQRCDMEFIRTEVDFVDYVRDRGDADIHVLVTTQPTGVGGMEYAMSFIGLGRFAELTDDLRFTSTVTNSQDDVRRGMARVLEGGLIRYAVRTPLVQRMRLSFADAPAGGSSAGSAAAVRDPWDRWVFRTSLGGSLNREASYKSLNVNASASANRTTAGWKTVLSFNTRTSESDSRVRDNWIENEQRDHSVNSLFVKSVSDHWSVGGRTNANHSTFQNRDLALRVAPALEFNVYPYSESTRRQLTFQYSVGANQIRYLEETIYGRMDQSLVDQALALSLDTRQTWGNGNIALEGSHYFHDVTKYRLQADAGIDLRIYRGLSLNLNGFAQRIRDQLHLVAGELSDEEILLRQRQIATSFRYQFSVGLGYSFGSIFSAEVNPRLGNAAGGQGGGQGGGGGGRF